ncbi:MAG: metal ABC transporter ATP-binding protein [Patescibacteria group bacterium]
MSEILAVENLKVAFGDFIALNNLSFKLDAGESLAIIGPNGSGKTVLLRALLHVTPYSGTVRWQKNIKIGYVPQKIEADRHLPLNLRNLLEAKSRVLKIKNGVIEKVVKDVGLDRERLRTPIGHLSGGEFQRALIAFALLGEPNVLLLDEPTASIDIPGEEKIYDLIHRLQDEHNITPVVVSHDLHFVYRYATKVLCLNKSEICFGEPQETLTPEALEKIYGPHKYYHHYYHKND